MNLQEYYQTPKWKKISLDRKRHDGFRCVICADPGDLQVHHNCYDRLGNEDISDLATMCARCHKIFHVEIMKNIPRNIRLALKREDVLLMALDQEKAPPRTQPPNPDPCDGSSDYDYRCPFCWEWTCSIAKKSDGIWRYWCLCGREGDALSIALSKEASERITLFDKLYKIEDEEVLNERGF